MFLTKFTYSKNAQLLSRKINDQGNLPSRLTPRELTVTSSIEDHTYGRLPQYLGVIQWFTNRSTRRRFAIWPLAIKVSAVTQADDVLA